MISPADAISTCFSKYVNFSGRATRAEYWWWALMLCVGAFIGELIHPAVYLILLVGLFLPTNAVTVRRLHDIDRSAWWLLIGGVPLIGWLVLMIFYVKRGSPGSNSYGPPA